MDDSSNSWNPSIGGNDIDNKDKVSVNYDEPKTISSFADSVTIILVDVDIIVPVHNAAETIIETVDSAMTQIYNSNNNNSNTNLKFTIEIHVCCYDDGSTDDSWIILQNLQQKYFQRDQSENNNQINNNQITSFLHIEHGSISRGAGYARNRAAAMRYRIENHPNTNNNIERLVCWLDSDDIMHPTRVYEQVHYFQKQKDLNKDHDVTTILLGCTFDRYPADSTWHYTQWANTLSHERLLLERFREVTIIQPTWMMYRTRYEQLGGYIEAPANSNIDEFNISSFLQQQKEKLRQLQQQDETSNTTTNDPLVLIHESETPATLRIAEDLRFFHSHLYSGGTLHVVRPTNNNQPLLTYRHRSGMSQSSQTPRKLLLQFRVLAFEECILHRTWNNRNDSATNNTNKFIIWGAGRDGRDFVKALRPDSRSRIYCFVDVDEKKINDIGYYENRDINVKIPIVHFSLLRRTHDSNSSNEQNAECNINDIETINVSTTDTKKLSNSYEIESFGRINKRFVQDIHAGIDQPDTSRTTTSTHEQQQKRKRKKKEKSNNDANKNLDVSLLQQLPVVVCVAMYRTNGALETNVQSIGRTEGIDLWHFS